MRTRSYRELSRLRTIEDRFEYLALKGSVGVETFGFSRYLNQALYCSDEWRRFRRDIIVRDNGCDLGVEGFDIPRFIVVHHINPITEDDILERRSCIFDPDNAICCSRQTHRAIHYGDSSLLPAIPVERFEGDTKLW